MPNHVKVCRRKPLRLESQISGNGESLQEHFRKNDCGTDIEYYSAVSQVLHGIRQDLEIPKAHLPRRGSIHRRLLMDNVRPDRGVYRHRHTGLIARCQDAHRAMARFQCQKLFRQRLAVSFIGLRARFHQGPIDEIARLF